MFLYSLVDEHLDCFSSGAVMYNTAVNTCIYISMWTSVFSFLGYIPSCRIEGSYTSVFNFLGICLSVFQNSYVILHSHQQYIGDSNFCTSSPLCLSSKPYLKVTDRVAIVRKPLLSQIKEDRDGMIPSRLFLTLWNPV